MRVAVGIGYFCCIAAFALGTFGIWGLFTVEGHRHFNEMDGLIPYFALVVAGGSAASGACLLLIGAMHRRKARIGFPVAESEQHKRAER